MSIDELIEEIKGCPNDDDYIIAWDGTPLETIGRVRDLKLLADEYEKLRKENAKLKYNKQIEELNMELSRASDFYDRDQITYEQYSNVLFSVESRKAALKAQQSGEEG